MRVEAGVVVEKNVSSGGNRKGSSRKKKRRQRKQNSAVQRLFEACKEVFSNGGAGIVPSPEDVERIRSVLDSMKPADVNLTPNMPYFGETSVEIGATAVTYLHLYESDKFSMGIFCLPASAIIPLHNHPGMTVLSKLLFGSMHIKSYDWADIPEESNGSINTNNHSQSPIRRLAQVRTDAVFTAPCNTSILYPAAGGNMHCFSALTPCAVLDVLGPPYRDREGRHCVYYNDFPYTSSSDNMNGPSKDGEYAWLEEMEKPDDFFVLGAEYGGPQVFDH